MLNVSPLVRRLMVLALLCLAVAAGWYAYNNKTRADRWQARSSALAADVDQLSSLLATRSDDLNKRIGQANALAAEVNQARADLKLSQGDVTGLESRSTALAGQKAQLEDKKAILARQRSALTAVASDYIICRNGLYDLLNHLVQKDYAWTSAHAAVAQAQCDSADARLRRYQRTGG